MSNVPDSLPSGQLENTQRHKFAMMVLVPAVFRGGTVTVETGA